MALSSIFSSCRKNISLLVAGVFVLGNAHSQNNDRWIQLWQTPGTNFYTIKNAFDSAWATREVEMQQERHQKHLTQRSQERYERQMEKLDGTFFQFKRWEYYMEPRVSPSGDLSLPGTTFQRFNEYLESNPTAMAQHNASVSRTASSSAWSFVGPTGAPTGSGAGRLCCIRFEPGNTNTIYVGAAAGGLWKSTDAGQTWICLTDFLASIGCSDIAIDPNNTNILYLGTGDNDAGDSPSIGVMKSIDGGITWNTTGLVFSPALNKRVGKLLIDPTNSNIIYAATSGGVYKTTDAGINWYLMTSLNTMDMEFKPGDPNTIYSCRVSLFKSTNGGVTWTQVITGLPQSNIISRMAIAVSPAAPNNVYVVAAHSGSYASEGVYLSTNSGNSFVAQSGNPNLLGWDPNGGDTDGQGWYDLAIAVDPANANTVIVGGVNTWRSNDAGVNWLLDSHWYGGGGAPYVHADCHDIIFDPVAAGTYFIGCDGGIFKTSDDGASFSDLSNNLCIAQIYRGGVSGTTAGTMISGHQDNGTNVKVGANYFSGLGGDGMDCFIDRTNDNNMFGELYYGDFYRSNNGGINWSGITTGTPGNGDWVTPWEQDPVNPNILYSGFDQLYKSTNQGNSWSVVRTQGFGVVKDIEVAPSNTQYIYISTGTSLYRSTDGGINFTFISGALSGLSISRVAVSPYDANKIWVSVSGYTANSKVFFSTNGGTTFTNISYGLPNLPANCVVVVPGTSSDAVYVGMDVGVYYRDNSSPTWQPFFTNLPNAPVFDLDVFLPSMKLTAFTYGRGVWEASIDQTLLAPLANFSALPASVCPGQTVQFTDLSTFSPTSWSWNFPGGTPSSSTLQNPAIVYNTAGVYPVTLVASNSAGSGTITQTSFIYVNGGPLLPFVEGFIPSTFVPTGWSVVNVGNQNALWKRSATTGHNSTQSAYFDNFNYNIPTERDEMRTMGFNFTGYTSLTMSFDVAYAKYSSSRSDTLEILASTDCGTTWTQVYLKGGSNLSTVSSQTSAFTPTNTQWRNDLVNIAALAGQGDVIFSFKNHNHHGNFLWVDNINISGTANAAPVANFSSAQMICENASTSFTDLSSPIASSWSWTFLGGNPATSTLQNPTSTWTTAGTYTVSLVSANAFGNDSTSQIITVNPPPSFPDAGVDTNYCSTTYVQLNASGGVNYNWSPTVGISNPYIASPGIYLTTSTTFSVTVMDINGCSAMDTVHVGILPIPNFSVNAAPISFCLGDSSLLVCNNSAWAYTWSPASSLNIATGDSVYATPISSTTYSITAVDTNGCVNSSTKSVIVYPPLPVPTVLSYGWVLTCSTPGFAYQWYLNGNPIPGATSQTYTATVVGNYSVEAHSYQNCSSGISPAILVDGVEEQGGIYFNIAPNPNNGLFDLSFVTNATSDFTISIFSVDGKIVYVEELPKFSGTYNKQIDLSGFGAGMYLIKLENEKQLSVQHIIVF